MQHRAIVAVPRATIARQRGGHTINSKKPRAEIRNWVTPEDLNVAPELLGLPLAPPRRRAAAMAIDLALIGLLSSLANAWLLAAGALLGVAWPRAQRKQLSRGRLPLAAAAAAALLAIGLWQAFEPRDGRPAARPTINVVIDDDEPASAPAVAASAAASAVSGAPRAWRLRDELRNWRDEFGLGYGWSLLYFSLLPAWWGGQTVGKRLLGLRVVELCGKPLTALRCLKRYGGYAAGLATGGIGLAQLLWDPNRQALQDRTAHTVVIDLRQPRRLAPAEWQALAQAASGALPLQADGGPRPAPAPAASHRHS